MNTMKPSRSFSRFMSSALVATAALVGLASQPALAAYPDHPIKMIVPHAAGTSADLLSRTIVRGLADVIGGTIVVENRLGANGNVGMAALSRATPDGYTIGSGNVATHGINPAMYSNIPYDARKDFTALGLMGTTPTLLVVNADLPVKNVQELIALGKSRPGKLSFASSGNGTTGHLAGELIKLRGGFEAAHIPYKDATQALTDLVAGRLDYMFYHPAAVMPYIQAGRLRAIGVSSLARSHVAPDIPPVQEQGVPDFDLMAWWVMYAPPGLDPEITKKLRDAMQKVVSTPAIKESLAKMGFAVKPMSPAELDKFLDNELVKWADLVKRSNAKVD